MKILQLWMPVVAWAGLIFYLSGIPDLKTNLDCDFILRKIAHMTEYLILTWLLSRALRESFALKSVGLFIFSVCLSVLYSISDEFHQSFVQGRVGSLRDVLIDSIGVLGFFLVRRLHLFRFCRKEKIRGKNQSIEL